MSPTDGTRREQLILWAGFCLAVASSVFAYRVVGPYGDGPFGAGFRRIHQPATGETVLVYDHLADNGSLRAVVDRQTRRLTEFRIDTDRDGRTDATASLLGDMVRVERDDDGDGVIDRWEYVDGSQEIAKVGFSVRQDGVLDAWAYYDANGALTLVEVATARNDTVNRWEYYENAALVRLEEDTTGDGAVDRWSTYVGGVLTETRTETPVSGPGSPW